MTTGEVSGRYDRSLNGLIKAISDLVHRQRERRAALARFHSYVDPRMIAYVLSDPEAQRSLPKAGTVEFVVALVGDDDLGRLPGDLAEAVAVLRAEDAWVETVGSLLYATFGAFPDR